MWTGVAEDSREPVVELAKLTEFDFCEFWIDFNAEVDAAGPPLANGPGEHGAGIEWRPCNYEVVLSITVFTIWEFRAKNSHFTNELGI